MKAATKKKVRRVETGVEMAAPDTRRRILDVGLELFAQKGVDGTSVRDICRRAEVNVAAVNYHFGGKERLYAAVLEEAFERLLRGVRERGVAKVKDPVERLRRHVAAFCMAFLGEARDLGALRLVWLMELARPSKSFEGWVETFMRPNFDMLRTTLRELSPKRLKPEKAAMHAVSVVSQIAHYVNAAPVVMRLWKIEAYPKRFAARVAEHVVDVTLRAIGRPDLADAGAGERP